MWFWNSQYSNRIDKTMLFAGTGSGDPVPSIQLGGLW